MTPRPTPRKSALSGQSVIAPHPVNLGGTPVNDGKTGTAVNAGNATLASQAEEFEKLTIRVPRELAAQVRAAYWMTAAQTGTRSLSAWITLAMEVRLREQQDTFNDGKPFPHLPTGHIPTGRR